MIALPALLGTCTWRRLKGRPARSLGTRSHMPPTPTPTPTTPPPPAGGTPHKTAMATTIGVWFVNANDTEGVWHGSRSQELVLTKGEHTFKFSDSLPCKNELAFVGIP